VPHLRQESKAVSPTDASPRHALRSAPDKLALHSGTTGFRVAPASTLLRLCSAAPEQHTSLLRLLRSQAGAPVLPLPPTLLPPSAALALACTELVCTPTTVEGYAIILFFGPFFGG